MNRQEEENFRCEEYVISVLRALLKGETVSDIPESISFRQIYWFSRMHSVEYMMWQGILKQNVKPVSEDDLMVCREWEHRTELLLTQGMVQLGERDVIIKKLLAAGIPVMPLKGCWLKELYPQNDYRQMADLDMLIHPEDAKRARHIMEQLGYMVEHFDESNHDNYMKKPYMSVELHRNLLPKVNEHHKYFLSVWDRAVPVAERPNLYRMSAEDEYIFLILHLKKHLYGSGAGIRYFMDVYVFKKHFNGMDQDYLDREFSKLGITEFVKKAEKVTECFFDTGKPLPSELEDMKKLVLHSGMYGSKEIWTKVRMKRFRERYHSETLARFHYYLSRFFMPPSQLQGSYPILRKVPVLLPVFWVVRIIEALVRKPEVVFRELKAMKRKDF